MGNTSQSKSSRAQQRRANQLKSINEQIAWWKSTMDSGAFAASAVQAEVRRLEKRARALEVCTPSSTWAENAVALPVHRGGEFPPGGSDTRMRRAKGERRLYPPQYIVTSGHCYDVLLQRLHARGTQHLIDDGYLGGRVKIFDLPRRIRQKIHEKTDQIAAKDRAITNVF